MRYSKTKSVTHPAEILVDLKLLLSSKLRSTQTRRADIQKCVDILVLTAINLNKPFLLILSEVI